MATKYAEMIHMNTAINPSECYEDEDEDIGDDGPASDFGGEDEDNANGDESISSIETSAMTLQANGEMSEFINKVKRMCELEDRIKEINADRKVLADEKNSLRAEVMDFMQERSVSSINYKSEVLFLETRESAGSLTRKSLMNAIKKYYQVENLLVSKNEAQYLHEDVQTSLKDAEALYNFVNNQLGSQSKVVLVREVRDKKKRSRKAIAPLSVYDNR